MDEKLVKKIQKLLALSESSNEHEAQSAMLKAQELLIKHKLSLKEVKEFKTYNDSIKEKKTKISFKKAKWKAELASLVGDNFGCYVFFKTRYSHTITFFGKEEDIIVCNIMLEYAVDCINNAVKKLRYQYLKEGYSTKGIENDYAMGFINGLSEKFEEQKQANQEWGLILLKDEEVTKEYNKIDFRGKVDTNTSFQGHNEAYFQGLKDGKKFSISDRITEEESTDIFSLREG